MLEAMLREGREAGLDLSLRLRSREFRMRFTPGADAPSAREAAYRLLALEASFLVFIEGAPPCLMPDAFEHFSWPVGEKGPFRRVPACRTCALACRCPGAPRGLPAQLLSPVLPAPSEIVLELSKECNLACRACFGREALRLPAAAGERALREAARLGVKSARFTGGEPLLHPDLYGLLKLARKLGFYILLNTNGTLLDRAAARRLAGLADNALISLPGTDEASHAAATGRPGSLAAKAAAVKLLRAAGVKVVRAGTVISRRIAGDFKASRARVGRMGFDIWELYRPMLGPAALAAAPEFRVTAADMRGLASQAAVQGGGLPRAVLANPVPFCSLPAAARPWALGARFDDGWTRLVLDPSGRYKPSYPSSQFLGRTLKEALGSPYIKELRAGGWLPRACRGCRMLNCCLGGSRFQAGLAGNTFGRDPWMKL